MTILRIALGLGAVALATGAALNAQGIPSVAPGARVRLAGPALGQRPVQGVVQAFHGDTVVLRADGAGAPRALPLSEVTKLEVSRGAARRTVQGAWLGSTAGAIVGLAVGIRAVRVPDNRCSGPVVWMPCVDYKEYEVMRDAGIGGLVGAGLGAIAGSLLRKERWETVPKHPMIAVGVHGRGVGLSLAF